MIVVRAKQGESPQQLVDRFRKKVLYSGIVLEARERARHKTEAERRKERKYRIRYIREIEKMREAE